MTLYSDLRWRFGASHQAIDSCIAKTKTRRRNDDEDHDLHHYNDIDDYEHSCG